MIAAPGARALKLPSVPRGLLLSSAQVFEDLSFEAGAPEPLQERTLRFIVERSGEWCGLLVHVELFVLDGSASQPEVSSAEPDSHWPNVLLTLRDRLDVAAGQRVEVKTSAVLDGPQPLYHFDISLDGVVIDSVDYP
jgi:hypothetical protein